MYRTTAPTEFTTETGDRLLLPPNTLVRTLQVRSGWIRGDRVLWDVVPQTGDRLSPESTQYYCQTQLSDVAGDVAFAWINKSELVYA